MLDLRNLRKWRVIQPNSGWAIPGNRSRTVTVDVRVENPTAVYITEAGGEVLFLARVETRERIRFTVPDGDWMVVADYAVHLHSIEMEHASVSFEAPRSWTKIMERRKRNPELEQMMALMAHNMERRIQQVQDNASRQIEAAARSALYAAEKREVKADDKSSDTGSKSAPKPEAKSEKGDGKGEGVSDDGGKAKSADAKPGAGD